MEEFEKATTIFKENLKLLVSHLIDEVWLSEFNKKQIEHMKSDTLIVLNSSNNSLYDDQESLSVIIARKLDKREKSGSHDSKNSAKSGSKISLMNYNKFRQSSHQVLEDNQVPIKTDSRNFIENVVVDMEKSQNRSKSNDVLDYHGEEDLHDLTPKNFDKRTDSMNEGKDPDNKSYSFIEIEQSPRNAVNEMRGHRFGQKSMIHDIKRKMMSGKQKFKTKSLNTIENDFKKKYRKPGYKNNTKALFNRKESKLEELAKKRRKISLSDSRQITSFKNKTKFSKELRVKPFTLGKSKKYQTKNTSITNRLGQKSPKAMGFK